MLSRGRAIAMAPPLCSTTLDLNSDDTENRVRPRASRWQIEADRLSAFYEAISRRVIRQAPIRSGSTIQRASEVPACAHWVGLMTSTVVWPRARALSTHGAMPENTGSESTAIHDIGSAKRRTMAGVGASRIAPSATPTTIPAVRLTADWPI